MPSSAPAESATQIICRALGLPAGAVSPDGAACRICGGPLLLPAKPASALSDNWTDENLCRRLDSDRVCQACAWFTTGRSNRRTYWRQKPVFVAGPAGAACLDVEDFPGFLRGPFDTPCVIMIRGRDPNLTQKHLQWRALDAVTHDRTRTRALFVGLQQWKNGGRFTGIAQFDADDMAAVVDGLVGHGREYVAVWRSGLKKPPTAWVTQNQIFAEYQKCLADTLTVEHLLAAYVASFVLAAEFAPGDNRGEVAAGAEG